MAASGFALESMPIVAEKMCGEANLVYAATTPADHMVDGYDLLSKEAFRAAAHMTKIFNVASARSRVREEVVENLMEHDRTPRTIPISAATVHDVTHIGEGEIVRAKVALTSNSKVGRFFHANVRRNVAYDHLRLNDVRAEGRLARQHPHSGSRLHWRWCDPEVGIQGPSAPDRRGCGSRNGC